MDGKLEFPAYNLFVQMDGLWEAYSINPIIGKTIDEVKELAKSIIQNEKGITAVRIFGIFNRLQYLVEEVTTKTIERKESSEQILRNGALAAIAICDEALKRGFYEELSTSTDFEMIRKILLESL